MFELNSKTRSIRTSAADLTLDNRGLSSCIIRPPHAQFDSGSSHANDVITMDARSPMLRSACSGPRGGEVRPLRRRKSGSETPKLQSMSYRDAKTLRSVFPAPLRDARLPLQRSQLLRLLARHGLKFWSLRPRLPTAKWSQFLSPWPETCRTRRRRSLDHRIAAQQLIHVCCS